MRLTSHNLHYKKMLKTIALAKQTKWNRTYFITYASFERPWYCNTPNSITNFTIKGMFKHLTQVLRLHHERQDLD